MTHTTKTSFLTSLNSLFTNKSATSQTSGLRTLSSSEITQVAGGPEIVVKPH